MADYDFLPVSNGSGDAVLMHISSDRIVGATTIVVDSVVNVPATFIGATGTLLASGFIDPATKTDFKGHTSGGNLIIDAFEPGSTDVGNTAGQVVVIKPNTGWANRVASFIKNATAFGTPENVTFSQLTLSNTTVLDSSGKGLFQPSGWRDGIVAPNTVTALGNRSYNLVFNGTDLTGTLSSGMRLKLTRTVTAPTQSTSLNGTTQYYSKTSPAGMTFTNNFVVSAWVKLSSYNGSAAQYIASRYNGTSGWTFTVETSGQIQLAGFNGGAGNNSLVKSYQSIPLNKWVHVAAQLDMATFTATPTTSYVMIDGVDVPATVTRAGSNPTALVQAGNLEIGSSNGGTNPFSGKLAQVAIYSAKVTEATILASMNQTLTGSETSLISAYSFNNSINDLNANANNLTANGSAVATATDSPFGNSGVSSTLEYGIITANAFSTNTTLTVQVPEGCAIPTSGGVSAVSYSTQAVPYGFPKQRGKWEIYAKYKASTNVANTSIAQYAGQQINAPIGDWDLESSYLMYGVGNATGQSATFGLSTATNSFSEDDMSSQIQTVVSSVIIESASTLRKPISLSAATIYYMVNQVSTAALTAGLSGTTPATLITLRLATL